MGKCLTATLPLLVGTAESFQAIAAVVNLPVVTCPWPLRITESLRLEKDL